MKHFKFPPTVLLKLRNLSVLGTSIAKVLMKLPSDLWATSSFRLKQKLELSCWFLKLCDPGSERAWCNLDLFKDCPPIPSSSILVMKWNGSCKHWEVQKFLSHCGQFQDATEPCVVLGQSDPMAQCKFGNKAINPHSKAFIVFASFCFPALPCCWSQGPGKRFFFTGGPKENPFIQIFLSPGHTPTVQRVYHKLWGKSLWESPAYTTGKTSLELVWIFTHGTYVKNCKIVPYVFVEDEYHLQKKDMQ